jgi:hypothetical protein
LFVGCFQPAYYTAHFVLWYLLPLAVILIMYGRISCTLWATSATAVPQAQYRTSRNSCVSEMPDYAMSTQVTSSFIVLQL